MTALPLIWGEGDAADILADRTQRSPVIAALDKIADIRAIDVIDAKSIARRLGAQGWASADLCRS
jgi:hypothetical protein